jgi:hypothetical protein
MGTDNWAARPRTGSQRTDRSFSSEVVAVTSTARHGAEAVRRLLDGGTADPGRSTASARHLGRKPARSSAAPGSPTRSAEQPAAGGDAASTATRP